MKNKLLSFILAFLLVMPCMLVFTACGDKEKVDPTLYHLTLSSNIELDEEQKQELKAEYAYGEHGELNYFPEDEKEPYIEAGADVDKAGVEQEDGSYYFFGGDPLHVFAPEVAGYKFLGFYNKKTDEFFVNSNRFTDVNGAQAPARESMPYKDIELEARYQKWTYSISFDAMETGDENPNDIESYCFLDQGVKYLLPAIPASKHKTFVSWEYQDTLNNTGMQADWIPLEKVGENFLLPNDYCENYMRLHAVWDVNKYKIEFAFELDEGLETKTKLEFDQALTAMFINGNLTTIDGVVESHASGTLGTPVTSNSEIKLEYYSGGMAIFYTLNPLYRIAYFTVNGERNGDINASHMDPPYISIREGDIVEDSTITFVLAYNIEE